MNKSSVIDWSTVPVLSDRPKPTGRNMLCRQADILVIRMADSGKAGIVEKEVDAIFASYLIRLRPRDERLRP